MRFMCLLFSWVLFFFSACNIFVVLATCIASLRTRGISRLSMTCYRVAYFPFQPPRCLLFANYHFASSLPLFLVSSLSLSSLHQFHQFVFLRYSYHSLEAICFHSSLIWESLFSSFLALYFPFLLDFLFHIVCLLWVPLMLLLQACLDCEIFRNHLDVFIFIPFL